jgi:LCP family protein required for cell wall assembly
MKKPINSPKFSPSYLPALSDALPILARLAVLFAVAVLAGLLTFFTVRSAILSQAALTGPGAPGITPVPGQALPEDLLALLPSLGGAGKPIPSNTQEGSNLDSETAQLTPWDGTDRVTVLIMGLDYRDWQSGEKAARSDTMILLSLDPLTKTASMLSIPRDLWVAIPGFEHAKINTAHYLGDAYNLPGGGPGLAVKTVEQFLGVPINYYAVIDFETFVSFIDEIGGVKVDVPEAITIDMLGDGPDTIKTLQPGVQVLPGSWALAYARQRHTQNGDFDRARRQQQVILGIRNRILSVNMLPVLITKAPELYRELKAGIRTNLGLDDAIRLALLAQQVPDGAIQRGVLDQKYVVFGRSPDNLSILIPIPDKINNLRDELFASGAGLGPLTNGYPAERMQAESASLAIYNGSRENGLASRLGDYLKEKGGNIVEVGDAPEAYAATTIIDHTGSPYAMKYLVDLLGIVPSRIKIEYNPAAASDVEVYLGYDAEGVILP